MKVLQKKFTEKKKKMYPFSLYAKRSLALWNDLLYSLRLFQNIWAFSGGRSLDFGQYRILCEDGQAQRKMALLLRFDPLELT